MTDLADLRNVMANKRRLKEAANRKRVRPPVERHKRRSTGRRKFERRKQVGPWYVTLPPVHVYCFGLCFPSPLFLYSSTRTPRGRLRHRPSKLLVTWSRSTRGPLCRCRFLGRWPCLSHQRQRHQRRS